MEGDRQFEEIGARSCQRAVEQAEGNLVHETRSAPVIDRVPNPTRRHGRVLLGAYPHAVISDRIVSVEAIPLEARFAQLFKFGTVDRRRSSNVVLRIRTDSGAVGYGEACPVGAFTSETQESIVDLIESVVSSALVGRSAVDRAPLLDDLAAKLPKAPFTLAAADIGLLDLQGKLSGLPASALLGGAFRQSLEVHGSVGWDDDPAAMVATATAQLGAGYGTLKLYAGRGNVEEDVDRIRRVRASVPDSVRFLLDVNGLWSQADCTWALPHLAELGVVMVEQPLAPTDPVGLAAATATNLVNIGLDESVFLPSDVVAAAAGGRGHSVNLGISKLGGPTRAMACATVCRAARLGVFVGSVLELGIANAAGIHVAAAQAELAFPSYLVGPLKYVRDVVATRLQVVDGRIPVPTGAGLGIEVDDSALAAMDLRRR